MNIVKGCFWVALVVATMVGCGNSSPAGNDEPADGEVSVSVDFLRNYGKLKAIGGIESTSGSVRVVLEKDDIAVTDAVVKFEDQIIEYTDWLSSYVLDVDYNALTPGSFAKVSITLNGTTYADSIIIPGGITLSQTGLSASWNYEGNRDQVHVSPLNSNDMPDTQNATFSTLKGVGTTATNDVTSPFEIAGASVPSTDWYEVMIYVQSSKSGFASIPGIKSGVMTATDVVSVDFSK